VLAHVQRTARSWRSYICAVASLTALLLALAGSHSTASADCTTGGIGCVPGSGYTFDRTWNCGAFNTASCYYNGTTSSGSATANHWGWGSASYDGAGDVFVCIQGESYFVGCAYNLARACFYASCDDQDAVQFFLFVRNQSGVSHTVSGHGLA
jgi:hypothetical protein